MHNGLDGFINIRNATLDYIKVIFSVEYLHKHP